MNTESNVAVPAVSTSPNPEKKVVAKKPVAKKTTVKQPIAKKPSVKKVPAKQATAQKSATKKTTPVKALVKKTEIAKVKPVVSSKEATNQKIKTKKQKMVRDSFTMPEQEYQTLGDLKKMCLKQGIGIKKSELLRIGVAALKAMTAQQIDTALAKLEKITAGRPKKD